MDEGEVHSRLRNDFLSSIGDPHFKDGCIFCKIAQGKEPKAKILFKNEAACVFHDIRPSTKEHLLIIPKSHHGNVKSLDKCQIPLGKDWNEAACVFHDIRPSTKEHLLIIPKSHHGNVKSLDKCQIPLVQYLYQVGEAVLEARGGNIADARVGFHWPPFNTIDHLHLHVVYPTSEMNLLGKIMNRPNSFWFVTYEWALNCYRRRKRLLKRLHKRAKQKYLSYKNRRADALNPKMNGTAKGLNESLLVQVGINYIVVCMKEIMNTRVLQNSLVLNCSILDCLRNNCTIVYLEKKIDIVNSVAKMYSGVKTTTTKNGLT
eukprot:XP_011669210.1 PREDICTED: uncharacterized protein LOC105440584 [Strongylocentrotus purpuratus]